MSDLEALRSAMTKALEGLEGPDFYVPGNAIPYLVSAVLPVVESFLSSGSGPPKDKKSANENEAADEFEWGVEVGNRVHGFAQFSTEAAARQFLVGKPSAVLYRLRVPRWEVAP